MVQNFLVRWEDEFLQAWDGKSQPHWVEVPSLAAHFEYSDADSLVQDLAELGWDCWVTDLFGNAATVEVIQRELSRPDSGTGVVRATDPEYDKI